MTERAYAAAKKLSICPSATPAERENAALRCREYEAAQPRPNPPKSEPFSVRFNAEAFERAMRNMQAAAERFNQNMREAGQPRRPAHGEPGSAARRASTPGQPRPSDVREADFERVERKMSEDMSKEMQDRIDQHLRDLLRRGFSR